MKILVTGGMGFLGSHLVEKLLKDKHQVYALDVAENNDLLKLRDYTNYIPIIDSILNIDNVKKLIEKCDFIYHLAAVAEPEQYVKYPRKVIEINLKASLKIIDEIVGTDKKLFFASTSEIYGKNIKNSFSENDDRLLGPTSVNRWSYSTSKAMIEHYLYALKQESLIDFVGIRIFNAYGPRLNARVVSKFLDCTKHKKSIIVHGDGSQKRCFTYISDIIDAIKKIVENKNNFGQFYNVGNPNEEYSIKELALMVQNLCEKTCDIKHVRRDFYGNSYEDIDKRVPDISKIENNIGWKPEVDLKTGLKKYWEYLIE